MPRCPASINKRQVLSTEYRIAYTVFQAAKIRIKFRKGPAKQPPLPTHRNLGKPKDVTKPQGGIWNDAQKPPHHKAQSKAFKKALKDAKKEKFKLTNVKSKQ